MKFIKEYRLFENLTSVKKICDDILVALPDTNIAYYVGESNSGEIMVEVYNNEEEDENGYNDPLMWSEIKEDIITLLMYLTEVGYVVNEILFSYFHQNNKSFTIDDILNDIDIDDFIELKIYIKNENT